MIGAAVLTRNPVTHDRVRMLDECLGSLTEADTLILVDNASAPDEAKVARKLARKHGAGYAYNPGPLTSCEHGTNLRAAALEQAGCDLSVISDDDIWWRPGWRTNLEAWWQDAPDGLVVTGCHVEPDYPWNPAYGELTLAGLAGALRASTGSGTWSFRDWRRVGPLHEWQQGWGDVPACHRLRAVGLDIAQIDLAEHRGEERSTWGNVSHTYAAQP